MNSRKRKNIPEVKNTLTQSLNTIHQYRINLSREYQRVSAALPSLGNQIIDLLSQYHRYTTHLQQLNQQMTPVAFRVIALRLELNRDAIQCLILPLQKRHLALEQAQTKLKLKLDELSLYENELMQSATEEQRTAAAAQLAKIQQIPYKPRKHDLNISSTNNSEVFLQTPEIMQNSASSSALPTPEITQDSLFSTPVINDSEQSFLSPINEMDSEPFASSSFLEGSYNLFDNTYTYYDSHISFFPPVDEVDEVNNTNEDETAEKLKKPKT